MKDRTRVALAIVAGYYLGRRHKLRLAAALVAAGVAGRLQQKNGGLFEGAMKVLSSSPELERIADRLRGDLMQVGKAAAVAATSRQVDSLSSKLRDRAEGLRHPPTGGEEEEYEEEQPNEEEEREEKPPARKPRGAAPKTGRSPVTRTAGKARR